MNRIRAHLFAALALLSSEAAAQAGRTPTDIDLKAGYCLAADRAQLESIQAASGVNATGSGDGTTKSAVADLTKQLSDDIARLSAYINPKLALLNGPVLLSAADRGIADVAAADAETTACRTGANGNFQAFSECLQSAPATARFRSCKGATFLPF